MKKEGKREAEEGRKKRRQKKNKRNIKFVRYAVTFHAISRYLNTGPSVSSVVIRNGVGVRVPVVSAWKFILSAAYRTDELVSLVQQIKDINQKNKTRIIYLKCQMEFSSSRITFLHCQ